MLRSNEAIGPSISNITELQEKLIYWVSIHSHPADRTPSDEDYTGWAKQYKINPIVQDHQHVILQSEIFKFYQHLPK